MATFTVRGKNIEITPSLREYVEKRVGKIEKYFEKVDEITVLLTVSKGRHIVEVTVPVPGGVLLRGEEATMDMYTSVVSARAGSRPRPCSRAPFRRGMRGKNIRW